MVGVTAADEVVVHGVPVRVRIAGEGPVVLVLHGMAGAHVTPGFAALSSGHQLVLPEHPGFGGSPQHPSLRSVDQLALLYLDLIDQLGHASAPVLGHSFGGWIAAEMAAQAALSKLILVDAMGCRVRGEDREDIFLRPRDAAIDLAYPDRSLAPTDGTDFDDVRNLNALAHYGWNPYLCDPSLIERLHRIQCPTLIAWGAEDRVVPIAHAEVFRCEIPDSSVVEIPLAGHDPTCDQPEEFATAVRQFLAQP